MTMIEDVFGGEQERLRQGFTSRDVWRVIFKYQRLILATFLVVTAVVASILLYLPPVYVAEAKVLIQTEQQGKPSFFSGVAAYREQVESDPVNRKIETEMEMLSTRTLSEGVVRNLGLQYGAVYRPAYVHLLDPLSDAYDWIRGLFGVQADPEKRGFNDTVKYFNKSFEVSPLKSKSSDTNSNLIQLKLKAPTAKVAQESLENLLADYLHYSVQLNQQAGEDAYKVISERMHGALQEVLAAQAKLREFMTRRAVQTGARPALVMAAGNVPPGAEGEGLRSPLSVVATPGDPETVRVLKSRLIDLELQLGELRRTFRDDAKNVVNLRHSIAELKSRIEQEIRTDAQNQATMLILERNLASAEGQYNEIKKKQEQIALFLKMNPQQTGNRVVTDVPLLPKSSEWKKSLFIGVLGSLAGLVLGLGLAGYREYVDHTLQSPFDVEQHLGIEMLGHVVVEPDSSGAVTKGRRGE